ncbi:MAG TPA: DUF1175 family protein [Terriglobales bacterium]|jgi:uncharacterized protein YfaT (DUF1175 family)
MRGVPRWAAVLAVVAMVAMVCAFTVRRVLTPAAILVHVSQTTLPADGFASTELTVHSSTGRDLRELRVEVDEPHRAVVDSVAVDRGSAVISVRAGVLPGETKIQLTAPGFVPNQIELRTTAETSDSVGDGTPDFLRLHDPADRAAFRRWFTLLAEAQYYRGNTSSAEINDCAALLRYAYREALRQHDSAWAKTVALAAAPLSLDIRQYQYPYTPLGAGLFRIREGSFVTEDLNNGAFVQFADAKTLWRRNTYFVGRDTSSARAGDLLFFRQSGHALPFHAMIFLGPSQIEPMRELLVIYHTGPIGKSPGEIRRPTLTQLLNFPDPRWRPVPSNPGFLGVYRWNILRGAD